MRVRVRVKKKSESRKSKVKSQKNFQQGRRPVIFVAQGVALGILHQIIPQGRRPVIFAAQGVALGILQQVIPQGRRPVIFLAQGVVLWGYCTRKIHRSIGSHFLEIERARRVIIAVHRK